MSFLSRSKLNISDTNSSGIYSKIDDRSRRIQISPNTSELMGSLEGFRQGLRKQLTEKLKSPTSTTKFVGIPSPKNSTSIKDRSNIGLNIKPRGSPIRIETIFPSRETPSLSSKPSMKNFDVIKDINKKIQERSPPRRDASRDLTLLNSLEKKFSLQNTHLSPNYRTSFTKKSRSPFKEYGTIIESRTPTYKKSQILGTSYLGDRSLNRATKEMKQSLIKILDNNPTPTRQRASPSRLDSDRPYSALSQGFSQLKSSRILLNQSPEKREDGANKFTSESLKTLSSFVSESFKHKEKETNDKFTSKRLNLFNGFADNGLSLEGVKRSSMSEKLPLSKVYEIQDLIHVTEDKEFNNLSPEYIEELIKLSSMIMQKVKASHYYNRE